MHQDAGVVVVIVGVASNMRPPVHNQHLFAGAAREPFSQDAAGEPGSNDQIIKMLHL